MKPITKGQAIAAKPNLSGNMQSSGDITGYADRERRQRQAADKYRKAYSSLLGNLVPGVTFLDTLSVFNELRIYAGNCMISDLRAIFEARFPQSTSMCLGQGGVGYV